MIIKFPDYRGFKRAITKPYEIKKLSKALDEVVNGEEVTVSHDK